MLNSRSFTSPNANRIEVSPQKFYQIVDLAMSFKNKNGDTFAKLADSIGKACDELDRTVEDLAVANNALLAEVRQTTRRRPNPFDNEAEDPYANLRHTLDGANFLRVIFDVMQGMQAGFARTFAACDMLREQDFVAMENRVPGLYPKNVDEMQTFALQIQLNQESSTRFIDGVLLAESVKGSVVGLGRLLVDKLDSYYGTLLHRHTTEGIQIHGDPVVTDLALSIFENVDASGEIKDGKKVDEISAYSIRKATIVAESVKRGVLGEFIQEPGRLIKFLQSNLQQLWDFANSLQETILPTARQLRLILGSSVKKSKDFSEGMFREALTFIDDLNPQNITFRDKQGIQTAEDRHAIQFQNETLKNVVRLLQDSGTTTDALIQYILQRKAELHTYEQDVNSFYVCKIGNGNPFGGEPPGMLTLVPGTKPVVNLNEVVGSGFDRIKGFIENIRTSAKWHDLFLATSPSKSADKANALLIGPQGCGKSEVLRGVGGDQKSIGIYAQPSDFLTCWKGEAEKNPKRLFEGALKLQKESGKQVFILIDEVDTILNDDHARGGFGSTNLTTEFQQLMDGIMQYPHIAVWAATNHPERIPMPMIRRFNQVAVVGELSQDDRVRLLKHFVGDFLPVDPNFPEAAWQDSATLLEGAVGDTIRKVADYVWREQMAAFVEKNPSKAEELVAVLNKNEKFRLTGFTKEQRADLLKLLTPHVQVKAEDVVTSVAIHLDNIAIRTEIATAVETYERSKHFLAGIKTRNGAAPREPGPKVEAQAEAPKKRKASKGDRVGAIMSSDDTGNINFLGFGVYEGDEVPPNEGPASMTASLHEAGVPNPKIKLDNGDVVWGCECWWGPEEAVKAQLEKASEVKTVKVSEFRSANSS